MKRKRKFGVTKPSDPLKTIPLEQFHDELQPIRMFVSTFLNCEMGLYRGRFAVPYYIMFNDLHDFLRSETQRFVDAANAIRPLFNDIYRKTIDDIITNISVILQFLKRMRKFVDYTHIPYIYGKITPMEHVEYLPTFKNILKDINNYPKDESKIITKIARDTMMELENFYRVFENDRRFEEFRHTANYGLGTTLRYMISIFEQQAACYHGGYTMIDWLNDIYRYFSSFKKYEEVV